MIRLVINPALEKQAFDTHLNYADCLKTITESELLVYKYTLDKLPLPYLGTKDNLIGLTMKSLRDEYDIVQIDMDYSYASTSSFFLVLP